MYFYIPERSAQAELFIRAIKPWNTLYLTHSISIPQASNMGEKKLRNLCNLGLYSSYKKLASYRKPKQNNKENVSQCDNWWLKSST